MNLLHSTYANAEVARRLEVAPTRCHGRRVRWTRRLAGPLTAPTNRLA